jgi:serine/threonine-protein kinase RsbT
MEACRQARQLAERLGFSRSAAYHVATAASELAANLFIHGGGGMLQIRPLDHAGPLGQTQGLELLAEDQGPGIADPALALTDGYSTGQGLGCGLPGVKRLMDEFAIESRPGPGTRIRAVKWR